jgi:uncharacterized protein
MKTYFITGASSGIGRHVALDIASTEQSNFIILARRTNLLDTLQSELEEKGSNVLNITFDLRNFGEIKNIVQQVTEKFGEIDTLINVAGLGYFDPIDKIGEDEIIEQVQTNVIALMLLTKYVAQRMIENKSGHIINISSIASFLTSGNWSVYNATKSAVKMFSDSIRHDLEKYNIKVTTIMPGPIDTDFFKNSRLDIGKTPKTSIDSFTKKLHKAIISKKRTAIIPWYWSIVENFYRFAPRIADGIIGRRLSN